MAIIQEQYWLKDGVSTQMDDSGLITHQESSIIKFDEVVLTGPEAIADSGFEIGQEHRTNPNLYLNGNIQANPIDEDSGAVWRYDLTYTTNGFNVSIDGNQNNRVQVNTGSWTYNAVVESDKKTQKDIKLPTGEPYDPMPEEIIAAPILIITKRENSALMNNLEYIGSINRSGITIAGKNFPAYCAMFADYQSDPNIDDQGNLTFLNTYTIKGLFKKDVTGKRTIGFQIENLARGFNYLDDNNKLQSFTTKVQTNKTEVESDSKIKPKYQDVPVSEPQLLDEKGKPTTTPYYQYWVVHDLVDFSTFNLPSSYPIN
jgi:hypothetical protein